MTEEARRGEEGRKKPGNKSKAGKRRRKAMTGQKEQEKKGENGK